MTDSVAFSPQGLAQLLGIYRYIEKGRIAGDLQN